MGWGWKRDTRQTEDERTQELYQSRKLSISPDGEGMYLVRGKLPAEVGLVVRRAIRAVMEQLFREGADKGLDLRQVEIRQREAARLRADALGLVAESVLGVGMGSGGTGETEMASTPGSVHAAPDRGVGGGGVNAKAAAASSRSHPEDGTRISAGTPGSGIPLPRMPGATLRRRATAEARGARLPAFHFPGGEAALECSFAPLASHRQGRGGERCHSGLCSPARIPLSEYRSTMSRSPLPSDLTALVSAVRASVEKSSQTTGTSPEEQTKGDGSLVTKTDMALQRSLTRNLEKEWPGIPVLGEESGPEETRSILEGLEGSLAWSADPGPTDGSDESGSTGASFWCLDPLDGTSNFVAGIPVYAASVALVDEDGPRLGVVYDLARDETFAAVRGGGAWLGDRRLRSGEGAPDDLADAMALVDLKRLPGELAARVATEHPFRSQRNIGSSALEWCWVAAGRCHLYLHGSQKPWDYAAGMLILAEAGGRFVLVPEPRGSIGFDLEARSVTAAASETLLAAWRSWILGPGQGSPGDPGAAGPPTS